MKKLRKIWKIKNKKNKTKIINVEKWEWLVRIKRKNKNYWFKFTIEKMKDTEAFQSEILRNIINRQNVNSKDKKL